MAPSNLPVFNSTLLEYQQLITHHQDSFIHDMPKVEMHIHIEGSMTPELRWELAARYGDKIPNPKTKKPCRDLDELRELYKILQDHEHGGVDGGMVRFFELYYAGFTVLKEEEDFYRLAMNYYERASKMNVRYCEPFFDPQGHTTRGVTFETMMAGFLRAQTEAEIRLNVSTSPSSLPLLQEGFSSKYETNHTTFQVKSRWVMCMLRDMSPESAMQHCVDALPYRDLIAGVGLDSLEENRPPMLFDEMFRFARQNGWKITCHCDVGDKDTLRHIDQAVHHVGGGTVAGVDRIDHGLNAVEDASLLAAITARDLGMTICPWGYLCYSGSGDVLPMVRRLFDEGIKIAIGSDDPAYMENVWLSNSLYLLRSRCEFTDMELLALQRNAVTICWAPEAVKAEILAELSAFEEGNFSVAK